MLRVMVNLASEVRPNYPHFDLTERVIGSAIEVHKAMGPGFLEKVYETAFALELADQGIRFVQQAPLVAKYKGRPVGYFFADFLVEETLICELKAVDAITDVHQAQVLNYLRATDLEVGLLINFGENKTRIKRFARQIK